MVAEPEATIMQATYEVVSATATVGLDSRSYAETSHCWKIYYYCADVYGSNWTYYNSSYDCRKYKEKK